jgi:hypothetical protein
MKMKCIPSIVLGAVMAQSAVAADFRVVDFDAACDDIAVRETQNGTRPVTGKLPSGYQLAFAARELGREVTIAYACKDGRFFRGAYIFDVRDGDDATQVYTSLKQRVTREFGAPYFDFASAEYRQKLESLGATLSLADTQVAFWRGKNCEAHASVAEPSGERGWRVSLSYTANSALAE